MTRAAVCWVPVHTALLSLGPPWLKAFPQAGGGHAAQTRPWAGCGCPAVALNPAALGKHPPQAQGERSPWAHCAELTLLSLRTGDPGDRAAGDRDTR